MIIYLVASYLRWLWDFTEPMSEQARFMWGTLSFVETFIELGIIIAIIIAIVGNKGDK